MTRFALIPILAAAACSTATEPKATVPSGENAHLMSEMATTRAPLDRRFIDSMAVVGDIDGDGLADTVIFDDEFKRPQDKHRLGALYIVYGTKPLPTIDFANAPRLEVDTEETGYVYRVAPAGDLDGDGLADFVVTQQCEGIGDDGGAFIIYGSPQRFSGSQPLSASGAHLTITHGCYSFAAAADLDGDGKSDLALSAFLNDGKGPPFGLFDSRMWLFYGGARWTGEVTLALADAVLSQPGGHGLGCTMAPIGDVDGDGYQDLYVAEDVTDGDSYRELQHRAHIVYGGAKRLHGDLVASDLGTLVVGYLDVDGDQVVAKLGDIDGDGIDDFAVAAASEEHLVHLFYGRRGGFGDRLSTGQADAHFVDHEPGGDWDVSIARAGAIGGSGRGGIVIGDPARGDGRGAIYVLPGGARYHGDVDVDQVATRIYVGGLLKETRASDLCPSPPCDVPEQLGGLLSTGDIDGDGVLDAVTANYIPDYNDELFDLREVYLLDLGR